MNTPGPMLLRSYAKINWVLEVLHRRQDGYHEIRTILQTVSLYDDLRLTENPRDIEVTCSDPRVPCDSSNLVCQAAALLREATGCTDGARIEITKRIPVGGGLGGGSSNAAAALLGLSKLWGLNLPDPQLFDLAGRLGSDVPFFLLGGTALGIGKGNEVCPLEEIRCPHLVLVNPGFEVSTAGAYARHSRLTRPEVPRMIPFTLIAAKGIHELPLAGRNDLEEAVSLAHPEIGEIKRKLLRAGARHALMSGSGATVFGVFENRETQVRARDEARSSGFWAECVEAVGRPEYARGVDVEG